MFWHDDSIDFSWKWSERVTKPLLVPGSTQVHQEAGTLVEGPGVRRGKRIGCGALAAFWLSLSVFAVTLLTSRPSVLRTPSLSTGPASTPVASSSSWARGSSGKPSVSPKVYREISPCKTPEWICREDILFNYELGNNISGDLRNLSSCVVPLTHPQLFFVLFLPAIVLSRSAVV